MLMECRILLMGNTVKWQGGDIDCLANPKHCVLAPWNVKNYILS